MKVLFDSDALFALYVSTDIHHQKAKQIFQDLLNKEAELWVTNLVIQEATTVISYRLGQNQAKEFLNRFNKIDVKQVFVSQKLTAKAWQVFKRQNKRGTSFVDCANLAVCKEMKINKIFSFDQIYAKLGLKTTKIIEKG